MTQESSADPHDDFAGPVGPEPPAPGDPAAAPHGWPARLLTRWPTDLRVKVIRLLIATGGAGIICLLLGRYASPTLTAPIVDEGFPIFANFNYTKYFFYYRLVIYAFPILAIVFYAVLVRVGPLRPAARPTTDPGRRRLAGVALAEDPTVDPTQAPSNARWFGLVARLGLPTAVVVAAAGSTGGHIGPVAIAGGVVYLGLVFAGAFGWLRFAGSDRTLGYRPELWRRVALINGAGGAVAALLALWFVSAHTVIVAPTGRQTWPWLPLWLALLGVVGVLYWTARQVRADRPAVRTERLLLTVVVGAVAVFLATSVVPTPISQFQGFDDALAMAGANLLNHGFFPWRDLLFTHGLYLDVFTGNLGQFVFGDTAWAIQAIDPLVLVPLAWVVVYLFAAWISRANGWFLTLLGVSIAVGFLPPMVGSRFMLVPLTFVVLGETIRRRRRSWYVGLTLLLFVQAILVPETSLLTAVVFGCIVAVDLTHRVSGVRLWAALRMTRWSVATGAIALAVFLLFLAWHHAIRGFVDYYLIVGPGHNDQGALPIRGAGLPSDAMTAIGMLAVLLTVWITAARLGRRGTWTPRDWVGVAAAGLLALYGEKALGRYDYGHVWQVFGVALPAVLWWAWRGLAEVGAAFERLRPTRWSGLPLINAATVLVLAGVVVVYAHPFAGAIRGLDSRHQRTVPTAYSTADRLGYSIPGSIDTAMLHDLDTTLRTYAGTDEPVFDMTNSLGWVYYLLDREPGSQFPHISLAAPPFAQQLLISELERSRPPVVIFDSTSMGMPSWDGLANDVRHYEISQYVLDNWAPVLRTHGILILVRRDLVAAGLPALPTLSAPPETTDLLRTGPSCDWGYSPSYLQSVARGPSVSLPVVPQGSQIVATVSGWAIDPTTSQPARTVVIASGGQAVATVTPGTDRPDIAKLLRQPFSASGFAYGGIVASDAPLAAYVLAGDGKLYPVGGSPTGTTAVRLTDGRTVAVDPTSTGYLDVDTVKTSSVGRLTVPSGTKLSDFALATISAGGSPLGEANFTITDQPGQSTHSIVATSLPIVGPAMSIRVGSCPQWHGYDPGAPLYVLQHGGDPITSVTLSGVRD